jgi:hypothetical protein
VAECSGGEAGLRPPWPLLGAVTHDTPVGWQWWRKETCESVRQSKRNKWSVGSYSYRPSLCFNTTLRRCLLQGLTKCIKPSAEGGPQVPSESNRLKSTLEFKICQPATKTRLLIVEDPAIPNFPNVKSWLLCAFFSDLCSWRMIRSFLIEEHAAAVMRCWQQAVEWMIMWEWTFREIKIALLFSEQAYEHLFHYMQQEVNNTV